MKLSVIEVGKLAILHCCLLIDWFSCFFFRQGYFWGFQLENFLLFHRSIGILLFCGENFLKLKRFQEQIWMKFQGLKLHDSSQFPLTIPSTFVFHNFLFPSNSIIIKGKWKIYFRKMQILELPNKNMSFPFPTFQFPQNNDERNEKKEKSIFAENTFSFHYLSKRLVEIK